MKKVSVQNLPNGAYIDKPVFLDGKYIILSPDIPVQEQLKKRLSRWNYTHVFTSGSPMEAPPETAASESGETQQTAVFNVAEKERSRWNETVGFFEEMCDYLKKVYDRYLQKEEIWVNELTERVKQFIQFVKSNRNFIVRINELNQEKYSYLVAHSVKTTIIALVMADTMKLPAFKQIDIGVASMLHEIGMLRIPATSYMQGGTLTEQQRKAIAAHTVIGFRILKEAQFSMQITRAVLEHHERMDGSGYPRGITGERVSSYAKILAVACSYVAIVSDRPHRNASDGHSGILDLLKNTGKQYDEQVLRVLVFALSIYPIGTYILLSNGSKGLVIETDRQDPRNPMVRLLIDEKGNTYRDQPILDTKVSTDITISRPLTQQEIEQLKTRI